MNNKSCRKIKITNRRYLGNKQIIRNMLYIKIAIIFPKHLDYFDLKN